MFLQNVVGVDIAALLLRNKDAYPYDINKQKSQDSGRRESVISQRSAVSIGDGIQGNQDSAIISEKIESKPRKSIEQITDEFRDTLLYGLVQEALGKHVLIFFMLFNKLIICLDFKNDTVFNIQNMQ